MNIFVSDTISFEEYNAAKLFRKSPAGYAELVEASRLLRLGYSMKRARCFDKLSMTG